MQPKTTTCKDNAPIDRDKEIQQRALNMTSRNLGISKREIQKCVITSNQNSLKSLTPKTHKKHLLSIGNKTESEEFDFGPTLNIKEMKAVMPSNESH